MEEAKTAILNIVDPPKAELDKEYDGRVVNITKFGAFVNILPGRDGLLHISKMGGGKRINSVDDVLELGQVVKVKVEEIDDKGKVSLMLSEELEIPEGATGGSGGSVAVTATIVHRAASAATVDHAKVAVTAPP